MPNRAHSIGHEDRVVTILADEPVVATPAQAAVARGLPWRRIRFAMLILATCVLYLWNLSTSGWANSFYSAAVQAGSTSWKAFLFGSSDAANSITVDKTPASLWVMDLSARLFGLSSWSVLVPQALEGVATVALLYAAVRRVSGETAALLAGVVLAFTPVAALMFRYNNPDALLVLLLVAAAYCVVRACEKDSGRWWLVLAGIAVGFGFLAKMLQAVLVLPGCVLAYLVASHAPLRSRLTSVLAMCAALLMSGGWYLALVSLWPVGDRPYVGGSQHNSILELALGYNGFGRLTGDETGGLGNTNFDVGWARLLGHGMGSDIGWLLPAAVIFLGAGLWITRRRSRTDAVRASLLLWGCWLLITGAVLSFANGIIHPYYTVALAPAIAAAVGIGAPLLWERRGDARSAVALSGTVLVSAVLACVLLGRNEMWLSGLRLAIAVVGIGCAVLVLVAGRFPIPWARAVAVLAVVACVAGPAAYSVSTALTPHRGAMPSSGPLGHHGRFGGFGPFSSPEPSGRLSTTLRLDADRYTWTAAVVGSDNAAGYQLATGTPVMAVGGYNGTDPSPTLREFQSYVAAKRIHYFVSAKMMGQRRGATSGSRQSADITDWVAANYRKRTIDGVTIYDLTAPRHPTS
jgi:4-amino-4-deoxy-L-arabinose transferase-like glycosyltransferase